jgi:hypothetical protein
MILQRIPRQQELLDYLGEMHSAHNHSRICRSLDQMANIAGCYPACIRLAHHRDHGDNGRIWTMNHSLAGADQIEGNDLRATQSIVILLLAAAQLWVPSPTK